MHIEKLRLIIFISELIKWRQYPRYPRGHLISSSKCRCPLRLNILSSGNSLKRLSIFFTAILFLSLHGFALAHDPVSLRILTLDDRPPNNLLLKQISAIAGINIVVEFDPSSASTADLVSLNAAVAGSLIGSRTIDPWNLDPPEIRPDALVHFAVPRIEPTTFSPEVAEQYSRIRQTINDPVMQYLVLDAIRNDNIEIDDPYFMEYVRRIRGWIDFISRAGCDPDRFLITLDDNRPGPLADGLKELFGEYSNYVYDGTDEGMMLLLARALRERQDSSCRTNSYGITWTSPWDLLEVRPFESATPLDNLLVMSDWLELTPSPIIDTDAEFQPVIWIHGSGGMEKPLLIESTSELIGDQRVIVADIALTNGGDPSLMETWQTGSTPPNLVGYLAWNTSSNTLGAALALWTAIDFAWEHSSDPEGVVAASEIFLLSRLIDDYLYQRLIRNDIFDIVRSYGGNPYQLTDDEAGEMADSIAIEIEKLWLEIGEPLSIPLRIIRPLDNTGFIIELPWNRLFEIAIYPTDDRGILPVIRPVSEDYH